MKKLILFCLLMLPAAVMSQSIVLDTVVFSDGSSIYHVVVYQDSVIINSHTFYSFPGLGTSHSKAAYGDHDHLGTYEPVIAMGSVGQYWSWNKTWQTLPVITPADKLLDWDGTQYLPYSAKKGSNPGWPYFYTNVAAYSYPTYNNHLMLDGWFYSTGSTFGTLATKCTSVSTDGIYMLSYTNGKMNSFNVITESSGNEHQIMAYRTIDPTTRLSLPIKIGDVTTQYGRVNEHIIVDPANQRFDINMTKIRFNKGTANKYFYLDANKEVSFVDLPSFTESDPVWTSEKSSYLTTSAASLTYEPKIGVGNSNQYWSGNKTWQTFPAPVTYSAGYGLGMDGTTFYNNRYQKDIDTVNTALAGILFAQGGLLSSAAASDEEDLLYMLNDTPSFCAKGAAGDILTEVNYGNGPIPTWTTPTFTTNVTVQEPLYNTPVTGEPYSRDISIRQSSNSQSGYLSSTDWNTFNEKVSSPWILNGTSTYYNGGNVGIGTTAPVSILNVPAGNILFGAGDILNSTYNSAVHRLFVDSKASAASTGMYSVVEVQSGAADGNYQGINGLVYTKGTCATNITASTNGGGLRNRYGVHHQGTGTVTKASGISAFVFNNSSASGTVTSAVCFNAENAQVVSGKTTTNYYGFLVQGGSVVGTLTNRYGLYVEDLSGGTNRFGVYQAGATDLNYFAGKVGIGTTATTALLDVNSDVLRLRTAKTPASATAAGNAGDICWDASYIYICTATNTWKRVAISTW
jgi:hypothetical protein